MKHLLFLLLFSAFAMVGSAQSDSLSIKNKPHTYTHRDSVYMAKLNSNGNLMIAGGVGLCAVGGYLIYEGNKVYTTVPSPTSMDKDGEIIRNHKQGTIYYAAGGVAIAAGIILTAFGAKNKVEFKQRKHLMELQSGILDNGNLGLALNF